jgi:drug/metabolite transporter (DMT)-like permease
MIRRIALPLAVLAALVGLYVLSAGTISAHEGHEGTPEPGFNYLCLVPLGLGGTASGYAMFRLLRRRGDQVR